MQLVVIWLVLKEEVVKKGIRHFKSQDPLIFGESYFIYQHNCPLHCMDIHSCCK